MARRKFANQLELLDKKSGTELKDWIQLPLWLYETHNSVNVRLRKERIALHDETEDQTSETDVMWPPDEECSACWLSPGRWDETKVYDYLHEIYWYEDENNIKISSGRRPVTAYDKLTGTSSSSSSSLPFSSMVIPDLIYCLDCHCCYLCI